VERRSISVGALKLDVQNPRHERVATPREAIGALISSQRQKLVVLANDIVEYGLSPIDRLLVLKEKGGNYRVVEGNRRLAAIRLLQNPDLADGTPIHSAIKRISANADALPDEADCAIAPSRAEAEHWMEIRHAGEAEGAGTVRWNSLATNRFSHKPNSQAAKAIGFLESVRAGSPDNDVVQDLSARVADKRLTTLGRLVADPNFKSRVGFEQEGTEVKFGFSADDLQEFFERVLGDLAADVGVSQLKSKKQRTDYLNATPEPDETRKLPSPRALSDAPQSKNASRTRPRRRTAKPAKPLKGLDDSSLEQKTQSLVRELHTVDVDKTPTASVMLIRSIVELAVEQYNLAQAVTPKDPNRFRSRLKACLLKLDPTEKDKRFQQLRTGLADKTSPFAVDTMHALVHNRYFSGDGTTARSIADGVEPLLQAINDAS
jgi:hypothetical protein